MKLRSVSAGAYIFRDNTYMSKLTLSVDSGVVTAAKRYARTRGLSISQMVEAYLSSVVTSPLQGERNTPILRALRGSLKDTDLKDYRKHLASKYR